MSSIIKIKRSSTTAAPTSLQAGELAYSEVTQNLFFGTTSGILKIGGNSDVQKLAAATAANIGDTLVKRDEFGGFFAGDINVGAITSAGLLSIANGQVTTTSSTVSIFNTNATTATVLGDATTITLGATTGTTTIRNNLTVNGQLSIAGNVTYDGTSTFDGDADFAGNVTIAGNLTVNGTTTTVNSTQTTLTDPVITLGEDTSAGDTFDRGVDFKWHDGTSVKSGFFGFDLSTQKFTFLPVATLTDGAYTGTPGTFVATRFEGLADRADKLETARTISLAGDITGSVSFDGSSNVTITTTIEPDSVALGTDTTGQYAKTVSVVGNGISVNVAEPDDGTDYTININSTANATPNTIVFRNSSGNTSVNSLEALAESFFKGGINGLSSTGTKTDLKNFIIDGGEF